MISGSSPIRRLFVDGRSFECNHLLKEILTTIISHDSFSLFSDDHHGHAGHAGKPNNNSIVVISSSIVVYHTNNNKKKKKTNKNNNNIMIIIPNDNNNNNMIIIVVVIIIIIKVIGEPGRPIGHALVELDDRLDLGIVLAKNST